MGGDPLRRHARKFVRRDRNLRRVAGKSPLKFVAEAIVCFGERPKSRARRLLQIRAPAVVVAPDACDQKLFLRRERFRIQRRECASDSRVGTELRAETADSLLGTLTFVADRTVRVQLRGDCRQPLRQFHVIARIVKRAKCVGCGARAWTTGPPKSLLLVTRPRGWRPDHPDTHLQRITAAPLILRSDQYADSWPAHGFVLICGVAAAD